MVNFLWNINGWRQSVFMDNFLSKNIFFPNCSVSFNAAAVAAVNRRITAQIHIFLFSMSLISSYYYFSSLYREKQVVDIINSSSNS